MILIDRLKSDPVWARDVLGGAVEASFQQWTTRRSRGRWDGLLSTREAVLEGFAYALNNLAPDTDFNDVYTAVRQLIDDYIRQHVADMLPYAPLRLDRGRKVRGRVPQKLYARGLPDYLQEHPVRAAFVISRIQTPQLKTALEMLRDGHTLRVIRAKTGLRGPALLAGYEKWHWLVT